MTAIADIIKDLTMEIDHLEATLIETNRRAMDEAERAGRNGRRAMKAEVALEKVQNILSDMLDEKPNF